MVWSSLASHMVKIVCLWPPLWEEFLQDLVRFKGGPLKRRLLLLPLAKLLQETVVVFQVMKDFNRVCSVRTYHWDVWKSGLDIRRTNCNAIDENLLVCTRTEHDGNFLRPFEVLSRRGKRRTWASRFQIFPLLFAELFMMLSGGVCGQRTTWLFRNLVSVQPRWSSHSYEHLESQIFYIDPIPSSSSWCRFLHRHAFYWIPYNPVAPKWSQHMGPLQMNFAGRTNPFCKE